jgi:glyoxylase-like metal-dependent hydrolase (beta-lactamase superfamily II)
VSSGIAPEATKGGTGAVGGGGRASGAVVDPVGDVEPYLRAAEQSGMRILYVIDTHVHADHVSAGRALAEAAGAEYVLSEKANVSLPFKAVRDGDELELGNVVLKVLHTPGHTPEHICLLVTDRTRAQEPWFVVTGHTLMVGDLGRTELAVSAVLALVEWCKLDADRPLIVPWWRSFGVWAIPPSGIASSARAIINQDPAPRGRRSHPSPYAQKSR